MAREKLNWSPKTTLEQLVAEMVSHDLELAHNEYLVLNKRNPQAGAAKP
jgi:hypothetical protein